MHLRHVERWILAGSVVLSPQTWANAGVSKSALTGHANDGPAQLVGLFTLKWGWLIGVVLIALVVIMRNRNAP
jgi:hypothetical protein